jgi:glycosyltransferase involved in cell wall biosynthesis
MRTFPVIYVLLSLLIVFLILGDSNPKNTIALSPEKAAALQYTQWPMWQELEPKDNRIKMLWVLHSYVPFVNAGDEISAHTMNRYWLTKPYKYAVYVACPGLPQRVFEHIRCFDLNHTDLFQAALKEADILHSHAFSIRDTMIWLSKKTGKPFVEWVHGMNHVRTVKQWNAPSIQDRHWTVFNSQSLRSFRPEVPDASIQIIYPIVNYREYLLQDSTRNPIYVTLSNVNENKGGHILIQLAKALPDMEFLGIIGGYNNQIVQNDIPNLRYMTHTNKIKEVYAQTWVLIMPSKDETWGRTAVEAMSSGIPIVVSPTPGLQECCADAALYCQRDDLEGWVRILRRLKEDREFYNRVSRLSVDRSRALDPNPGLSQTEQWFETVVLPSKQTQYIRMPTNFEKNLLFR